MATRKYLTDSTYPVASTTSLAGWEATTGVVLRALSTTKSGTNAAATQAETSTTNPYRYLLGQWVDDVPFGRDGIFGGSAELVIVVSESSAAADMYVRFRVLITSNDGSTNRAVFDGGGASNVGSEFTTTPTGRSHTFTLPDTAVVAGERVKLEVGYRATNAVATGYSGSIRYAGTAATDLASADTGTNATTRSPWIQFSDSRVDALYLASDTRAFLGAL